MSNCSMLQKEENNGNPQKKKNIQKKYKDKRKREARRKN